jgi:hypothetical protein
MVPLSRQRAKRTAATEPAAPVVTSAPAEPGPKPDGRAKRIGEAAEAATAVAKAVLFFGAVAIVGTIVTTTLWRDRHARHVEVSIDPEADRTLRAMGSQIDLRQTFVDVLNARIRGVEEIFALNFGKLIDTRDAPDVSFKPFGLDASTGQIAKIAHELTGAEPPTAVRIELLCPKAKCDDAGAPGASLLVTVVDRNGSERVAIPIGGVPDGLPRRLREAMRRAAALLLERAEPLIAAVYYFNVGQQRPFIDDMSRDMQRAMASALKLRGSQGQADCIANLVIGGTLFKRGTWEDGIAVEQHAARPGDVACEIHAETNIVLFLFPLVCHDDPAIRDLAARTAQEALAKIGDRDTSGLGDLVADRIPTVALRFETMKFLNGSDAARHAWCRGERIASGDPSAAERHVTTALDRLSKTLPPRASQRDAQALLDDTAMFERLVVPGNALQARYRASLALMRSIEAYLPTDATPRHLLALRGDVATEIAATAVEALALDDSGRRALLHDAGIDMSDPRFDSTRLFRSILLNRLLEARVDFQNALAAAPSPGIGEAALDVELGTHLGDASLLLGDLQGAREGYTRAIDAFLSVESPVDQLMPLADAVARLATLDRRTGVCAPDASRTDIAVSPIGRLGIALADWCSLGDAATGARPGLVGVVAALVKPSMDACNGLLVRSDAPYAAFRWVSCIRNNDASTYRVFHSVMDERNGATLRATIEDALKGTASGGS